MLEKNLKTNASTKQVSIEEIKKLKNQSIETNTTNIWSWIKGIFGFNKINEVNETLHNVNINNSKDVNTTNKIIVQ